MRTLLVLGLLAALALPARADIVDSGTLTIGGQGVIGGTFTVQGNALGVAGSVSATSATLSGNGAQIYSLTTSSGIHIVGGILRWPDGTASTSAHSGGGGGNVVLSATQTLSGVNTFSGGVVVSSSIRISPGGFLEMNGPSDANPLNTGNQVYWAKSIDGSTQSSGCLVAVQMNGTGAGAQMTFTSTTTILEPVTARISPGVLLESCAPGAACRVALSGVFRVQTSFDGGTNRWTNFSNVRCQVQINSIWDGYALGRRMDTSSGLSSGDFFWMYLGL